MKQRPWPLCPKCGQKAYKNNTKYGVRYSCHGLHAWGRFPLADPATHQAREHAHKEFDFIWKSGLLDRPEAYARLAIELKIKPEMCHMKLMDKETAMRVPAAAKYIFECEEDYNKERRQ